MAVDYSSYYTDTLAKVQQGQDYVTKLFDQSAKLQAGRQYAAGDTRGAATTVAGRGDIAGAAGIERSAAERLTMQQAYIKQALPVFQAALQRGGPEAVVNAYQQITPDLKRIGMSDEEISQFGQRLQADPQGTIQALVPIASQEVEYRQMGQEVGAFDKRGNLIRRFGPSSVTLSQGQSTFPNPNSGGPGIDPIQPQPTSGAPPSAPAVGGAAPAPAPDVGAPVPVPVPQTAAAPVVAPQPSRPAAGAVQPSMQRPPVAMAPDAVPPRPGVPPPSAASLGLANPEDPMGGGGISRVAAGGLGQATPEGVRPILSNPKPPAPMPSNQQRWRAPTPQEASRYPGTAIQVNETTGEIKPVGRSGAQRLQPQETAFLIKRREQAQQAQKMASDWRRFMELNRSVQTGQGFYFSAIKDIRAATDKTIGEMNAIVESNVPLQRQGLPGAATERDVQMFRAGGPTLDKTPATNAALANVAIAMARRQQDYVAFLENWALQKGTILGAQEAWGQYAEANPLYDQRGNNTVVRRVTPWRRWFGNQGTTPQSAPAQDGWSIQRVQ